MLIAPVINDLPQKRVPLLIIREPVTGVNALKKILAIFQENSQRFKFLMSLKLLFPNH